jgi:hypothetical protein
MAIGQINQRALGTDSVDGDAIINGEVTANHLHTTLDLSVNHTVTLPEATITAHQGSLILTTSQVSDIDIDKVLAGGSTSTRSLTVGDLTVTGNTNLASAATSIAYSIALG